MVITTINEFPVRILMAHNQNLLAMTDFKGYYYLSNDTSPTCSQLCRYPFYCVFQDAKTSYYMWRKHHKKRQGDAFFLVVLHFVASHLTCIGIYLSPIKIQLLIRNFMCSEIACWNCIMKSNACFWERLADGNLKYIFSIIVL